MIHIGFRRPVRRDRGFTLIELLVVIAIIESRILSNLASNLGQRGPSAVEELSYQPLKPANGILFEFASQVVSIREVAGGCSCRSVLMAPRRHPR